MPRPKSDNPSIKTDICLPQSDIDYLLRCQGSYDGTYEGLKLSAALSAGCKELIGRSRRVWHKGLGSGPAPAPAGRPRRRSRPSLEKEIAQLRKLLAENGIEVKS